MPDDDIYRKLLSGEITADEIQSNPELILMAKRIYGRDAIEDMGVYPKEIGGYDANEQGIDFPDLDLPSPISEEMGASKLKNKDAGRFSTGGGLKKKFTRVLGIYLLPIFIAVAVRIIAFPLTVDSHDIVPGVLSIDSIRKGGLPTSNAHWPYPIVFPIIAWPFFQLFEWFNPGMSYFTVSNEIAIFSVKMPMIEAIVPTTIFLVIWKSILTISNILTALIIAETFGTNSKVKRSYFFLVSLNPLGIYLSSVTGQIDGFMLDLFMISLCMMHLNRWVVAGIVMGLAVGVKGYILSIFLTITIGIYFGRLAGVKRKLEKSLFWKYFVSVALTGVILLLIQIAFSGDLLFRRGIGDRVYRPSGINIFSLKYLYFSDIIELQGQPSSGIELNYLIYRFLNLASENFITAIVILCFCSGFSMKMNEDRGKKSFFGSVPNIFSWQGLILVAWSTIFIQMGSVNTQYICLLTSLCVFSWIAHDSTKEKKNPDSSTFPKYLPIGHPMAYAAIVFHLFIMSPVSIFIPTSVNLTIVNIDFLIETIDFYYFSESTLAANRHEAAWGVIGPIAFIIVTFEVILHCIKIKQEG